MPNNKISDFSLKSHYKDEFLVYFRYFIECYFVPANNYDELPTIIKRYMKDEVSSKSEGLLKELLLVKEVGDWDYTQQFVRKYGMRLLSHEKLEAMVDLLSSELGASLSSY